MLRLYSSANSWLWQCRAFGTTWSTERWETFWERKTVNLRMMQYAVYAAPSICCTWCMLYLVYAVLGVCYTWCQLLIMAWRYREEWLSFVFVGDGWVEDETESDVKRWGKSSKVTGTETMLCVSQCTICDMEGKRPDTAWTHTDTRSF